MTQNPKEINDKMRKTIHVLLRIPSDFNIFNNYILILISY